MKSKYGPRNTNCPIIYPEDIKVGGFTFSRELIEDLRELNGIDIPDELFDYMDFSNRKTSREKINDYIYERD
jgi:hypothetical protein|tara:strand:- start:20893 stop:21108 length:216 start_codon:yes stop_codon:yes gene_type:complete